MTNYYDDNYGQWDSMDDPDMVDFYHKVQRSNVSKICSQCGRNVNIQPQYDICGQCADQNESGF